MENYPVFIDCPYYSKLPTDSMISTSKSQLHLSQKLKQKERKKQRESFGFGSSHRESWAAL